MKKVIFIYFFKIKNFLFSKERSAFCKLFLIVSEDPNPEDPEDLNTGGVILFLGIVS